MRKLPLLLFMVLVMGLSLAAACSSKETRVAIEGDTVSVHYHGTLDNGEVFDSSLTREPLTFVLGSGGMISGFDAAVRGMKVGDSKTVRLEPSEAYGEPRDDLVIEFPIEQLPEGATEGDSVYSQSGYEGVILGVTDQGFRVDFNPRFAGQALTFEIELVSIE